MGNLAANGPACSWLTNAVNPQQIVYKDEFLREILQIYPTDPSTKKTVHHMGAGTHEWNFKFTLRGSLPESVEGLAGSYIVYNLHATMDRGMMAKTLFADRHMRIIRTLASEILTDAAMEQVGCSPLRAREELVGFWESSHPTFQDRVLLPGTCVDVPC